MPELKRLFHTNKPIVVGINCRNLCECILDFTAGITDRDLYEFQESVNNNNAEYVMFSDLLPLRGCYEKAIRA